MTLYRCPEWIALSGNNAIGGMADDFRSGLKEFIGIKPMGMQNVHPGNDPE
jgi:hypothetical protein